MSDYLNIVIIGLGLGCVYGIVGLSFTAIYNASNIINFAQGDFAMIGGVTASIAVHRWGLQLGPAIVCLIAAAIVAALLLQYVIVEPLIKREATLIPVIIGTMAVALMMEGLLGVVVGYGTLRTATYVRPTAWRIGQIVIAKEYAIIVLTTVLITVLYWLFLEKTRWGIALRATGENALGAVSVGIPARRVRTLAFMISASIAALAGFLLGPLITVSVFMGFTLLINGFIASVIGGIARPYAALVGGVILGLTTSFVGSYKGYYVQIANMAVLMAVLLARPHGLFGRAGE